MVKRLSVVEVDLYLLADSIPTVLESILNPLSLLYVHPSCSPKASHLP